MLTLFVLCLACTTPEDETPPDGRWQGSGTVLFDFDASDGVYTCAFDFELLVDAEADHPVVAHTLGDCFNHIVEAPIMPKCWRGRLDSNNSWSGTADYDSLSVDSTFMRWSAVRDGDVLTATMGGTAAMTFEGPTESFTADGEFSATRSAGEYDDAECRQYPFGD